MKKRLLSLLLTLVMILGMLSATAFAASVSEWFVDPYLDDIDVTDPDNLGRVVTDGNGHYVDTFSYAAEKYGVLWIEKLTLDSMIAWTEEPHSSLNNIDKVEGTYYQPPNGHWLQFKSDNYHLGEYDRSNVNASLWKVRLYDIKNECYIEKDGWLTLDPDNDTISGGEMPPVGMYVQEYYYGISYTDLSIMQWPIPLLFGFSGKDLTITMDGQNINKATTSYHTPGTYFLANSDSTINSPIICDQLYVNSPVHYVYDVKPEIKSVKVNGTSVADGGTFTANSGSVAIKTNYDSKLSQALQDYGCSVKELSAYYLNGEKINVAALTPVDNGDGTATKTYSRHLTAGDELRVESWLEVKWPDGSTDRVDEHTVTVSRPSVAFDFANQNPVGSADETIGLTATSGDTKSYTFGSTAVPSGYYVEKKATLKGLFAGLDADQTVTVKDGSAATLTHTFINPGLYQLTETLKLYENGSTKVIATKSHKFLIEVAAADPAFVTQPHYEGKGMQMGTNYVSWRLNFTPVKLIARCNIGTHARPNIKEYELDPTKSFAALIAYSQKYVLYAYYGEGDSDYVASDAFSAEKPADFTPAFTKQPVGDQSLGGNPVEVTWATNFVPVKISIMQGTGVKPTMEHSVLDDATATSTLLGASANNYFICAYYSDTEYVTSNKFKITELTPTFTLQPADCVSLGGAYAEATWATNFTPVKLQVLKYSQGYCTGSQNLDINATTASVKAGDEYCIIRAYYSDSNYVDSNKFTVTDIAYYNAWFYVDDTVFDKVMVLEGDYVERPADPTKEGYKFIGWYTDDGEKYNFAATVTDDVHLTAKFEDATSNIPVILLGDVTGDGKVNSLDAAFVLRYDASLIGEDRLNLDAADVTGDGKINAQDAAFILRYDAGLLPKFPAEG